MTETKFGAPMLDKGGTSVARKLKKPLSSKCTRAVIAIQAQQMMPIAWLTHFTHERASRLIVVTL